MDKIYPYKVDKHPVRGTEYTLVYKIDGVDYYQSVMHTSEFIQKILKFRPKNYNYLMHKPGGSYFEAKEVNKWNPYWAFTEDGARHWSKILSSIDPSAEKHPYDNPQILRVQLGGVYVSKSALEAIPFMSGEELCEAREIYVTVLI